MSAEILPHPTLTQNVKRLQAFKEKYGYRIFIKQNSRTGEIKVKLVPR